MEAKSVLNTPHMDEEEDRLPREMATYNFVYVTDAESGECKLMIRYFPEVQDVNLVDMYLQR
jgi:hypothetical protein